MFLRRRMLLRKLYSWVRVMKINDEVNQMDVPGTTILCLCKEGSTTQSVLFFSTEYQSERAYAEPERCEKEVVPIQFNT